MIGDQFGGGIGTSRIIRSFTFGNLDRDFSPTPNFYHGQCRRHARRFESSRCRQCANIYPILDYNDAAGRLGGTPLAAVPAGGTLVGGTTIRRKRFLSLRNSTWLTT